MDKAPTQEGHALCVALPMRIQMLRELPPPGVNTSDHCRRTLGAPAAGLADPYCSVLTRADCTSEMTSRVRTSEAKFEKN